MQIAEDWTLDFHAIVQAESLEVATINAARSIRQGLADVGIGTPDHHPEVESGWVVTVIRSTADLLTTAGSV